MTVAPFQPYQPVYTIPERDREGRDTAIPSSADPLQEPFNIRSFFEDLFGPEIAAVVERLYGEHLKGMPPGEVLYELRRTPEYAARFPGMAELRKKGRGINEAQYIALERGYAQAAREVGLPASYYDGPEDFGRFIGAEQSVDEFRSRLKAWSAYERETRDPTAAAEYSRQLEALGIPATDGTFLAFFLDPDRAVTAIERAQRAAQTGTEAVRSGFGQLSLAESLSLADQGVTAEQARRGFDALAGAQELFAPLPGEPGDRIGRREQLGVAFGGRSDVARRLDTQRRRRVAEFEGGGGTSSGRGGLVGLAPAE